jgi:hypothetical protein
MYVFYWFNKIKNRKGFTIYVSEDNLKRLSFNAKNLKLSNSKTLEYIIDLYFKRINNNNPSIFDDINDRDFKL